MNTIVQYDWNALSSESAEHTVQAVLSVLDEGDVHEAQRGLEVLLTTLEMNAKHALKSQLTRLMMHIIKWHVQPERRSGSWAGSIVNARMEIEQIQEEKPSLGRTFVESIWAQCLRHAINQASAETGIAFDARNPSPHLTWKDVFESEYRIER